MKMLSLSGDDDVTAIDDEIQIEMKPLLRLKMKKKKCRDEHVAVSR